jgi:hypothetical protein
MKKEAKDKKSTKTNWVGKTATMAAVVAALGISLGVNVQKVYGGEDTIQNSGVIQDKQKDWNWSQQGKIESQQSKIESQQNKIKSQQNKVNATQHKNELNLETK